jgi:hypothetical protein
VGPKPSDFPAAIIFYAGQFPGGDKPRPYLFGETSFVVAWFILAWKGQHVEKIAQFLREYCREFSLCGLSFKTSTSTMGS